MKTTFRPSLAALALVLALIPSLSLAAYMPVDRQVQRLNQVVSLTSAQAAQATQIFQAQNNALNAMNSSTPMEERSAVLQNARAQIRALLTPAQLAVYNRTPQRLGGGARQDPANRTARLDQTVQLTEAQVPQVAAIYQQLADTLAGLTPDQLQAQGGPLQKAANAQLRALLTPDQQRKFDANPSGAEDLAVRAYVANYLQTDAAIAAQVGTVQKVSLRGTSVAMTDSTTMVGGAAVGGTPERLTGGSYLYQVRGSTATETLKITWTIGSAGQIQITGVQPATP